MSAWTRWVEACAATERGTSLALFRIAVGLGVLWTVGSVLYTGTLTPLWLDVEHGGMHTLHPRGLLALLGGAEPRAVWTLTLLTLVFATGLVVGIGGRLTAFITLMAAKPLLDVHPDAGGSYDLLLQNALWLTVLAPTTATLSVDARLREGRWMSVRQTGIWARYLIVFQLVLMYTSTGWQKLSAYWTPGGDFSALYYIFQQPSWQRFDLSWSAWVFPLTQVGTAVSWLWEITGPLLLLAVWAEDTAPAGGRFRRALVRMRVRDVYIFVGLVLHGSLLVVMNVGPFTPITLAFYPALLGPLVWERAFRRVLQQS